MGRRPTNIECCAITQTHYLSLSLSGNMFDWGAKAVSDILEGDVSFGLKNAMSRIYDRSWIVNGLPDFLDRMKVRGLSPFPPLSD